MILSILPGISIVFEYISKIVLQQKVTIAWIAQHKIVLSTLLDIQTA